jgi:hypothetical protein
MLMTVQQRFGVEMQFSLIARASTIRKMSSELESLLSVLQEPIHGESEIGEL